MIVIPLLRYLINVLIDAYLFVLFIRMIVDWAMILMPRWYPRGVVSSLIRVIYALTEPPLRWAQALHTAPAHGSNPAGCLLYGPVFHPHCDTDSDLNRKARRSDWHAPC